MEAKSKQIRELKFGTIEYWKEELKHATDLTIIPVEKSTNGHWDKGIWNRFRIFIVIDGKFQELRFTENETQQNLNRLPIKKDKYGDYTFFERVLGMDRLFSILYSLSRILYEGDKSVNNDAGYVIFEKFPSAKRFN